MGKKGKKTKKGGGGGGGSAARNGSTKLARSQNRRKGEQKTTGAEGGEVGGIAALERIRAAAAKGEAPPARGLNNLGNTCFFNAALQNVCRMRVLRDYFFESAGLEGEGKLTRALREFVVAMWSLDAPGSFSPTKLIEEIGCLSPRFRGRNQQDSHELLRALWDGIVVEDAVRLTRLADTQQQAIDSTTPSSRSRSGSDASESPPPQGSIVDRSVGGVLCSTITCHECGFVSTTDEPFFDISLSLVADDCSTDSGSESTQGLRSSTLSSRPKGRRRSTEPIKLAFSRRGSKSELVSGTENISIAGTPTMSGTSGDGIGNGQLDNGSGNGVSDVSGSDSQVPFDIDSGSELGGTALNSLFDEPNADNSDDNVSRASSEYSHSPKTQPTSALKQHLAKASRTLFRSRYKSLKGSLDLFTKGEILEGENGYYCEQCNKKRDEEHATSASSSGSAESELRREAGSSISSEGGNSSNEATGTGTAAKHPKKNTSPIRTQATKQFLIKDYPDVLILQLKRFSQNTLRGGLRKIAGHVSFPLVLDLADYAKNQNQPYDHYVYTLTGVVVHGGSLGGGHYTSYVREGCDPDFRGGWFYCSDSHVVRAKEAAVTQCEAYMLFYERRMSTSNQ